MNLFQLGDFILASGETSNFKIECDALTPEDWECLGRLLYQKIIYEIGPFGWTIAIPKGGWPIAGELQKYITKDCPYTLFVDDVWTTGTSMNNYINGFNDVVKQHVKKAVVFARNPVPDDVVALFKM